MPVVEPATRSVQTSAMNQEISLPPQVMDLLLAIAELLGDAGQPLAIQARDARVTGYSPTYIDLDVPASCNPGSWADGPLDVKPLVIDRGSDPVGEVLVWVSAGRVTLLEQAWFTDEPPQSWPSLEMVRIYSRTGYFGVRSQDGTIRAFFRPDGDPVSYF